VPLWSDLENVVVKVDGDVNLLNRSRIQSGLSELDELSVDIYVVTGFGLRLRLNLLKLLFITLFGLGLYLLFRLGLLGLGLALCLLNRLFYGEILDQFLDLRLWRVFG
jgi:hypothetical protein